jgi:hypothetical protein
MSTAEMMQAEGVLSRAQQKASPLYAGRVAVYPKAIRGRFRTVKWTALAVLLGLYYLVPWLRWDRGPGAPDQAVLVDLPGQRLYFFWIEIWPQEVYFLTGVLVLAAFGLFLATSLFGRLWCGFACPQTIWTDLYLQVERWIEGDRAERIRLDKAPWTGPKVAKRALKHAVWLLVALLTGGAWIMYFHDAPTVARAFFTGEAGAAAYFFVGLFTATTYLLAGFAREQVCTFMCPWPRIQGSLVDRDTLAVTYEAWRGEPRGPRPYRLALTGDLPATYPVVGREQETPGPVELRAAPDGVSTFQVYVTLPREAVPAASMEMEFEVADAATGATVRHASVFHGPER